MRPDSDSSPQLPATSRAAHEWRREYQEFTECLKEAPSPRRAAPVSVREAQPRERPCVEAAVKDGSANKAQVRWKRRRGFGVGYTALILGLWLALMPHYEYATFGHLRDYALVIRIPLAVISLAGMLTCVFMPFLILIQETLAVSCLFSSKECAAQRIAGVFGGCIAPIGVPIAWELFMMYNSV